MRVKFLFIAVLLLYLLVNIPGLFLPLVVNAAKYAQVGREIIDNREWIDLTIGGDAYGQKPPLLFWIAALVFRIFGVSVVAYKAAILLISLIGVYGTYRLGKLLYGERTGALAAFFWATCLGYSFFYADIHTDSLLVVPVILSIWQYAAYYIKKKEIHFYLGATFVALAMLTKGPVGMVIPAFAVGFHLLMTRNFRAFFNYRWLLAALLVAILILPALLGLYRQFGLEGIKFYFWTNNIGRITGSYHGSNTDPLFYIHTTLYTIAPWTLFGFIGFFMQVREKILKRMNFNGEDEFYLLGGTIFYLLVSSAARAKNPHYEMSVLPLVLILGARWAFIIFERPSFGRLKKIMASTHLVVALLLFVLVFAFLLYIFPENRLWVWLVVLALAATFLLVQRWTKNLFQQLAYLLIAISAFLFTLNVNIVGHLTFYHSAFEACRIFNEQATGKAKLHILAPDGAREWDILLYSDNYGSYMVTPEDFAQESPSLNDWVYTSAEGIDMMARLNVEVDTIQSFQHRSLSRISVKFLNPTTRQSKLSKRYLLKISGVYGPPAPKNFTHKTHSASAER